MVSITVFSLLSSRPRWFALRVSSVRSESRWFGLFFTNLLVWVEPTVYQVAEGSPTRRPRQQWRCQPSGRWLWCPFLGAGWLRLKAARSGGAIVVSAQWGGLEPVQEQLRSCSESPPFSSVSLRIGLRLHCRTERLTALESGHGSCKRNRGCQKVCKRDYVADLQHLWIGVS